MRNIIFPAFIEFRARGGRLIYGTVIEIGFKPSPKMAVSMRECEQPPPLLLQQNLSHLGLKRDGVRERDRDREERMLQSVSICSRKVFGRQT